MILSTEGGVHSQAVHAWPGGVYGWGVCMARGACMAGGGGHAWGACMVGDMHGGGHAWQGGCVWQGACMTCTPQADTTVMAYGQ